METTFFLAHLWGPILLAAGFGMFFNRAYYARVYRDLEQDAFAVVFFGMAAMAAGITQVLAHNTWHSFPEILISLLGWGLLLRGIVCTAFPKLAERSAKRALKAHLLPYMGIIVFLLGMYLSWFAYLVPVHGPKAVVYTAPPQATPIASATYTCDSGKTISAAFFEGAPAAPVQPGQPPMPTGSADVSLDGAASTTLHQTISADGARYANADESFVFWNKGNEAIIMRNNSMDLDYRNCTDGKG